MRKSLSILTAAALCVGCFGAALSESEITGGGVLDSPSPTKDPYVFELGGYTTHLTAGVSIFRLHPGTYTIGEDIPSGWYQIGLDFSCDEASAFAYYDGIPYQDNPLYWSAVWNEYISSYRIAPLFEGATLYVGKSIQPDGSCKTIDDGSISLSWYGFLPSGEPGAAPSATAEPEEAPKSFTVQPGTYSVPDDIPAGKYTISYLDSKFESTSVVWENPNNGWTYAEILSPDSPTIGQCILEEGCTITIELGSVHFEPSAGVIFDEQG